MAAGSLHISISAEPVLHLGGLTLSNSILASIIVSSLLIVFAVLVRLSLQPRAKKPRGLQNIAEWIVESLYGLVYSVTNSHKKSRHFFPLVATFFLFILLNNWLGLIPGVGTIGYREVEAGHSIQESILVPYLRAGTADLNTTLALATISVLITQFFGVKYVKLAYFKKFLNFSNPLNFMIGLLESVLEAAKIISFAFRLFGNIFAGEVLLAVITFLAPILVPTPFYGLEVVVGIIQALVFAMLSLVFFNMATIGHDEH